MKAFDCNGFAALSHLVEVEYLQIFSYLEKIQHEFLHNESKFRSKEYLRKWPSDALHWWSRCWEYPYVLYHLKEFKKGKGTLKVIDLGSGVTFFPFAVAREGIDVLAVDVDSIIERDLIEATKHVSFFPGSLQVVVSDGGSLPLEDEELDAAYCISVLEHLENIEEVIGELHRALKKNGILVLTIDVDVTGDATIGPDKFYRIVNSLKMLFKGCCDEKLIHPQDMLTSARSPYPMIPESGHFLELKGTIKSLLGRPRRERSILACYGAVYKKV